jgi:Rrf2 family nitric oxide-sensitive transcriptional repressor
MRLTAYSNYTLRVLMVAAARAPGLTTIQDVANGFAISKAHLVKCVHQLGTWGYLETVRGNGGGFRLAVPAATITLGEVIRRTEEGFSLVECFDPGDNTCPLVDRCRLRGALQRATEVFLDELDDTTLADITDNGDELLAVLELAVTPQPGCELQATDAAGMEQPDRREPDRPR